MLHSRIHAQVRSIAINCALCFSVLYGQYVVNGGPILYFDMIGYLISGDAVGKRLLPNLSWGHAQKLQQPAAQTNPDAQASAETPLKKLPVFLQSGRSIFYGIPANIVVRITGIDVIAVIQMLWMSLSVALFAKATARSETSAICLVLACATLTPLAFFCAIAIPDVFAGTALCAIAILVAPIRPLSRAEIVFWSANLLMGVLFHNAIAASMIILAALCWAASLFCSLDRARARLCLAVAVAGLVASQAYGIFVQVAFKAIDGTPPFVLARLIGDGTAAKVLMSDCPSRQWTTCQFVDRLPLTENGFLWGDSTTKRGAFIGFDHLPYTDRSAIKAEAPEIIRLTLTRYGGEQVLITAGNALRQFFDVSLKEFEQTDQLVDYVALFSPRGSENVRGGFLYRNPGAIEIIDAFYMTTYVLSLGIIVVATAGMGFAGRNGGRHRPLFFFSCVVLLGAVVSAAFCGGFGGVFGRYQARIMWPILGAAVLLVFEMWAMRMHGPATGRRDGNNREIDRDTRYS